ncbi:MAG: tryptophan synthase subunit alpha [Bacteroidales bacterium]|jgi:tryptophan synthase alpha chain|nr:tryptophan synthase subunit alpha [Bacteroidales bacterium]
MNRIDTLFAEKRKANSKILSVYFTAGFPKLNDTTTVLHELQAQGADLVEVGIPFSDPMADGVVIQQAGQIALNNGITLATIFEQLHNVRQTIHIPIILMGYLNPIMHFGFENFCKKCVEVGVDGVIIPDLPFADYMNFYKAIAEAHGIHVIMLITPETSEERVRWIDENTMGFIYMVSSAATTGAQQSFDNKKQEYFKRINAMNLHNPRLVGFGVSNKATFDAAVAYSAGAIVGSKFVQLLSESPSIPQAVSRLINDLKH